MFPQSFVHASLVSFGLYSLELVRVHCSPIPATLDTREHQFESRSQTSVSSRESSFPLGNEGVVFQTRKYISPEVPSDKDVPFSQSTIDLTSTPCNAQCLNWRGKLPGASDCDPVIRALKRAGSNHVELLPFSELSVQYGNCALIFKNDAEENPTVKMAWSALARQAQQLSSHCANGARKAQKVGVCSYSGLLEEDSARRIRNISVFLGSPKIRGSVRTHETYVPPISAPVRVASNASYRSRSPSGFNTLSSHKPSGRPPRSPTRGRAYAPVGFKKSGDIPIPTRYSSHRTKPFGRTFKRPVGQLSPSLRHPSSRLNRHVPQLRGSTHRRPEIKFTEPSRYESSRRYGRFGKPIFQPQPPSSPRPFPIPRGIPMAMLKSTAHVVFETMMRPVNLVRKKSSGGILPAMPLFTSTVFERLNIDIRQNIHAKFGKVQSLHSSLQITKFVPSSWAAASSLFPRFGHSERNSSLDGLKRSNFFGRQLASGLRNLSAMKMKFFWRKSLSERSLMMEKRQEYILNTAASPSN